MTDYDSIDYFTDAGVLEDPFPFYEHLRGKCPVQPTGPHGMLAITGCDEAMAIYRNVEVFSACNTTSGPFLKFPAPSAGEELGDVIDRSREIIPQNDLVVTMDPPRHTRERALLMRLITPRRLKENEAFMLDWADRQLDRFLDEGRCEFMGAYAKPYSMLVIADLLGVPEADHQHFKTGFGLQAQNGPMGGMQAGAADSNTLAWLYEWFATYIEERRREPKNDVLTGLAQAKYPDGSTPAIMSVVHHAAFLFAAGRETTSDMVGTAMKYLAEDIALQDELRAAPERIPSFIEECLRIDPPVRVDFRMAKRAVTLAGVEIKPGTPLAIFTGAANRDPLRFDAPAEFRIDRPNAKEHIAFGRGIHACPGAPLARAEGRITIERFLARTRNIRLSEDHHGQAGARRFDYSAALTQRSLRKLHIEFDRA